MGRKGEEVATRNQGLRKQNRERDPQNQALGVGDRKRRDRTAFGRGSRG